MSYLIDTHAFLWHASGSSKLSTTAQKIIESDHLCLFSTASIWEMAIKVNLGTLEINSPFAEFIDKQISLYEYKLLPVELSHLYKLSELERHHKDPFDRLIIAQALVDNIPVISIDPAFDAYGIRRIW